jgi:hypothetical protein
VTGKKYDQTTAEIINELFRILVAINPAFKQAWPTEQEFSNTKRQWVIAFEENGICSLEAVKHGISSVRRSPTPFIPSPGAFIEASKMTPEQLGAPSLEDAYAEACRKSHKYYGAEKNWSHNAVGLTAKLVGRFRLCERPERETFPLFKKRYIQVCQDYGAGRTMNQIEHTKNQEFTEVEMHWVLTYKKCINEGIEPLEYIPTQELVDKAKELYYKYLTNQQRGEL